MSKSYKDRKKVTCPTCRKIIYTKVDCTGTHTLYCTTCKYSVFSCNSEEDVIKAWNLIQGINCLGA